MTEDEFISLAIALSESCTPKTPDIPKVGCVVAQGDRAIAIGTRGKDDHAEKSALDALAQKGVDLTEATLYTTLEPCTDHARRDKDQSCTRRIISAHIRSVRVGLLDPNQDICGRGVLELQRAGVDVRFFPIERIRQLQSYNSDFIIVHQALGLRFDNPVTSVPHGSHPFKGTALNMPASTEVYAFVGDQAGYWWPQVQDVAFRRDEKGEIVWEVRVDLNNPGNYTLSIVRANALGRAAIAYYRKVATKRQMGRNSLIQRLNNLDASILQRLQVDAAPDADLSRSLANDHLGIEFGSQLPKGIDVQAWMKVTVT